jgi:hypothetical protein
VDIMALLSFTRQIAFLLSVNAAVCVGAADTTAPVVDLGYAVHRAVVNVRKGTHVYQSTTDNNSFPDYWSILQFL